MWPGGGCSIVAEAPLPAVGQLSTSVYELFGDNYILTMVMSFFRVRSLIVTLGTDK